MNQTRRKIKIAAIGDLHVHENSQGLYRKLFEEISTKADVLLLCGDLTNLGLPNEARNLSHDLMALTIPVAGVFGNHDHHSGEIQELKQILRDARMHFLDEDTLEIHDVGIAGVKGFGGGFEKYMLGSFGEEMTKMFVGETIKEALNLENSLKTLETKHKVVVLHYAPITQTVLGEPLEIYPYLGCSRFAEIIDRFDEIKAVFHGHSHHGSLQGKTPKGIEVYNCSHELLRQNNPEKPYVLIEV